MISMLANGVRITAEGGEADPVAGEIVSYRIKLGARKTVEVVDARWHLLGTHVVATAGTFGGYSDLTYRWLP